MGTQNIKIEGGKIKIDEGKWSFFVSKLLPIVLSLLAILLSLCVYWNDLGYRERAIQPHLNIWFSDDPNNEEGIGWFVYNAGMGAAIIKEITVEHNGEKATTDDKEKDPVWHFFNDHRDRFLEEARKTELTPHVGLDGISLKHAIQNGTMSKFMYIRKEDAENLSKELLEWFKKQINLKITIKYTSLLRKEDYVAEHNIQ